jgi:hypothetical protein
MILIIELLPTPHINILAYSDNQVSELKDELKNERENITSDSSIVNIKMMDTSLNLDEIGKVLNYSMKIPKIKNKEEAINYFRILLKNKDRRFISQW